MGTLAAPTNSIAGLTKHPATPGDTLILLASGLGPFNPPPVTGYNSLDTIRIAATPTLVLLGRTSVPVTFAGLSPQFVGVYQINVTVPFGVATASSVPLQIQGDAPGPGRDDPSQSALAGRNGTRTRNTPARSPYLDRV